MTDDKLIRNCIKGKRSAQNLFFERFKGMLMNISTRYARRDEEIDDIFQDAFVKVFNNLKQIKEPKALSSWVYQCAVRVAINHYRSGQNIMYISNNEDQTKTSNNDYKNIIDGISGEEIVDLIKELPNGYRVVFNMYVIDGFKHKEIAEILNISENTSRSQLKDARNALKQSLTKRGIFHYEAI